VGGVSERCTPFGRPVVPDVYSIWLPRTGSSMSSPDSAPTTAAKSSKPSIGPPTARRTVAAGAPAATPAATGASRASAMNALAPQSPTM
jgi:hypothetical protein